MTDQADLDVIEFKALPARCHAICPALKVCVRGIASEVPLCKGGIVSIVIRRVRRTSRKDVRREEKRKTERKRKRREGGD